ncbi:MAG: DUF5696 domain-containing protein [Defluviitaleaceae bacterium]|nr:DUF5696 domain-containing protein [Defluviitaleaceae bacterium]
MLRVLIKHKKIAIAFVLICIFAVGHMVNAVEFLPTNRDTRLAPVRAVFEDIPLDSYAFLGQFGNLRYYFRGDRDIIMVQHVDGLFTWRTGLDAPFGLDVPELIAAAETEEERLRVAEPIEVRLNAIWTAFANSLITVELFDTQFNVSRVSSASQGLISESTLMEMDAAHGHFRLDTRFNTPAAGRLYISVHIFLGSDGITYRIFPDEITGPGVYALSAIILTPFLGAAGGTRRFFDPETGEHGEPQVMPMTPGYIFVPDGSGALIRFAENTVHFSTLTGQVFGPNRSEATLYFNSEVAMTERRHPLMPVFGATHGYHQQAFVAWAEDGAQYMEIVMMPHNNTTYYNFVFPRFVVNGTFHQVYNRRGDGFMRMFPQRRDFDITMHYRFLYGEDASYVGMARTYRQHLIDTGVLTPQTVQNDGTAPIRVDFIMSDARRSILGSTDVVTTSANQVGDIIRSLHDSGVSSINSGMLGAQRGGVTTGHPSNLSFNRSVGTRRNFRNLFSDMADLGADVSFTQDFFHINSQQMNVSRNQALHLNRWGLVGWDSFEPFLLVNEISFARPQRSAEWLQTHHDRATNLGAQSVTVSGITNNLLSHWGRRDAMTTAETIALFSDTFAGLNVPINATSPNQYLWAYTTRFLQAPVFHNQFIIATDSVPFLQLVLHNTMEIYGPYANFSFYTQADILRMIDYNVLPSFVLTHSPAHYLGNTNSLNFFSTEYAIYHDIIMNVYSQIAPIMSQVRGLEWLNRTVLANGVVLNTYEGGVYVLINYTSVPFVHNGVTVDAQSARLIR